MTNKERYSEWAQAQEYIPLFMMPWWLDAVCAGKEWDVLLAEDNEGHIVGAMPYMLSKKLWFKYIVMPPYTSVGGIWVTPEMTGDRWKTAEVCRQITEQLDKMGLVYYEQRYLPGSLCVDALRALGFKTRERASYRFEDLSDLDAVIDGFSKTKRRQLQKALSLHAEHTMDVEDFIRFHHHCLAAKKRKMPYSREFLLVLERKAKRLGQCEILSIHNADGQPLAAAFIVWDKVFMHFVIPCYDPAFGESGASALLVLEALKKAREKHLRFEFGDPDDRITLKEHKLFNPKPFKYFSVEKSYKGFMAFIIRCAERFT